MMLATINAELQPLADVLIKLRAEGRVLIALLYGSFATGTPHARSDIDLALFVAPMSREEELRTVDEIVTAVAREVSILRLDDEEESPFVVQAALKGLHLVAPDEEELYRVADHALHESEDMRLRRAAHAG